MESHSSKLEQEGVVDRASADGAVKTQANLMRATAAYLTAHCSICQHGDASR
jgi:hypothetical protein